MLNTVTEAIERPFHDFPNTSGLLLVMVSSLSIVEELFDISFGIGKLLETICICGASFSDVDIVDKKEVSIRTT